MTRRLLSTLFGRRRSPIDPAGPTAAALCDRARDTIAAHLTAAA